METINNKVNQLTIEEQEVYDKAVADFKENITYQNMIKRNESLAEQLAVDYGRFSVIRYRRSQKRHYSSDHAEGYKI